jgi:hypothetical protein
MNQPPLHPRTIQRIVETSFGDALHAKQRESVGHSVVGALHADRAGVAAIGRAAARRRGKVDKHGIKQFDRYLSNDKVRPQVFLPRLARRLLAARKEVVVMIDWTEFAPDDHSTIVISMVTRHGRATPLVWKTVRTSKLKKRRAGYEDDALETLAEAVPKGTRVTVLADRGFGDQKRYAHVLSLGFHYVIRFRQGILLTDEFGESAPAVQWLHPRGRARMLKQVAVTADCYIPPAIVLVRAKKMKEAWCLATSRDDLPADEIIRLYGKRFSIEETFRDQKDRRFGLGLYYTQLGDPGRRDRMLLVLALAHLIATLLGAAGESIGLDRLLRANTVKNRRTHSLFRQGYEYLCGVIDRMLAPLRAAFFELLRGYARNAQVYAEI